MPGTPLRSFRSTKSPRHGLARVLSKLGVCSRSQAEQWVREGRVSVGGRIMRDPYHPTAVGTDQLRVDGEIVKSATCVYVLFNKPRGLVVSKADERGRDTVYTTLASASLPWLGPVGRLDKASEGLLLLSNDTTWAAGITDPSTHLTKTYHVQVTGRPGAEALSAMLCGIGDNGEILKAQKARVLREGEKNAWLEIVLEEGRNRHIRRLLSALGHDVLRLMRVAIGPLPLGELAKGKWRHLSPDEVRALDTRT
ncbi:MAG: rRNA pseudouridine synthase [Pseudomonadota bacterium]|nr:rRNA pseudouridine synthase [Pseudomonadota bacterium]